MPTSTRTPKPVQDGSIKARPARKAPVAGTPKGKPADKPVGKPVRKRGQGRPGAGENNVGKERLLAAATKLLRELPPSRVTSVLIAKEAGGDPALVRYYFGDRTGLLLAVADSMTRNATHARQAIGVPDATLADHIRVTLQFTRSAPFMHRLMLEELADAGNDASRAHLRTMNLELVSFYRRLLKADAGKTLDNVNPLFLHLLVLGISDFFASAQPLIRELVPPNTQMDKLAAGFEDFLVKIIIGGMRKT